MINREVDAIAEVVLSLLSSGTADGQRFESVPRYSATEYRSLIRSTIGGAAPC